jgi:hypothetical protein
MIDAWIASKIVPSKSRPAIQIAFFEAQEQKHNRMVALL